MAHSKNLISTIIAKSVGDAFYKFVRGATVKFVEIDKDSTDDKLHTGASEALRKIIDLKLRVVVVLATAIEVQSIALMWKEQAGVVERWAWITDSTVIMCDFAGDAPKVRCTRTIRRSCARTSPPCFLTPSACCDASQATATRRAFNGWLYISPLDPDTPTVRKFKRDVRELTESKFGITLAASEEIDSAAAKLYDGIFLWARALSRVLANNGAALAVRGSDRLLKHAPV